MAAVVATLLGCVDGKTVEEVIVIKCRSKIAIKNVVGKTAIKSVLSFRCRMNDGCCFAATDGGGTICNSKRPFYIEKIIIFQFIFCMLCALR